MSEKHNETVLANQIERFTVHFDERGNQIPTFTTIEVRSQTGSPAEPITFLNIPFRSYDED